MILDRLLRGASRLSSGDDSPQRNWRWWFGGKLGGKTAAGIEVNEDSAMTFSAVYRAISVLAETSSTLPLHVYRSLSEDENARASGHPAEALLDDPNPLMNGQEFREYLTCQLVGRGNAYAEIVRGLGTDGVLRPISLWPIPSAQVKPKLYPDSLRKYFEVTRPDGKRIILEDDECMHLRGKGDVLEGWSILRNARESIGLGLGAERHGASSIGGGNKPAGILHFKRRKPSDEDVAKFRANYTADHGGPDNAGKVGYLWGEDVNWIQTAVSNVDMEFLALRQFQVTEIARWFGVAPHLLYDLTRSTNNNIEWQGLEFLAYTLAYWLRKWELGLNDSALVEPEDGGHYFEHVTAALVKTDINARTEAYVRARQWGWLTGNEIRKKENERAHKDGDDLILPAGTIKVSALASTPPDTTPAPPVKLGAPAPAPTPAPAPATETPIAVRLAWLTDTLGWLGKKEAATVAKLAKDPGAFIDKLETFYASHADFCAAKLGPIVGDDAAALAKRLCDASFGELLEASGAATPAQLDAVISEVLCRWPARAAAVAKEYFA